MNSALVEFIQSNRIGILVALAIFELTWTMRASSEQVIAHFGHTTWRRALRITFLILVGIFTTFGIGVFLADNGMLVAGGFFGNILMVWGAPLLTWGVLELVWTVFIPDTWAFSWFNRPMSAKFHMLIIVILVYLVLSLI